MKRIVFTSILLLYLALPSSAEVVVEDGDNLIINGESVRLHGIDAPEISQNCSDQFGKRWPCGQVATDYLKTLVKNKSVTCVQRDTGDFDRPISVCHADGLELNAAMVNAGLAWSFRRYSSDYSQLEERVRRTGKGIWQAYNTPAWEFRKNRWHEAGNDAPGECKIKGNINSEGQRIYHLPWQRFYRSARIDVRRGERWFCDEKEALEAGWRRSQK